MLVSPILTVKLLPCLLSELPATPKPLWQVLPANLRLVLLPLIIVIRLLLATEKQQVPELGRQFLGVPSLPTKQLLVRRPLVARQFVLALPSALTPRLLGLHLRPVPELVHRLNIVLGRKCRKEPPLPPLLPLIGDGLLIVLAPAIRISLWTRAPLIWTLTRRLLVLTHIRRRRGSIAQRLGVETLPMT